MLSADQRRISQITAETNLTLVNIDRQQFLEIFVTVDETWARHTDFDQESKVVGQLLCLTA